MKFALGLIPRFKNLHKLHLCLRHRSFDMISLLHPMGGGGEPTDPMTLPGVETLFTLRNIPDIKVRDLELEDCDRHCKRDVQGAWAEAIGPACSPLERRHEDYIRSRIDKFRAALKHFNHGLQLAQNGTNVESYLYQHKGCHGGCCPALPDTPCGPNGICSCGDSEVEKEAEEKDDSD